MYFGHIYQLNSEPGRGRRGQIGFTSAAVERRCVASVARRRASRN